MKVASEFVKPLKSSEKWSEIWDISIFDHWLTNEEADNCDVLCYGIAIKRDKLTDYLVGENNFIQFYTEISNEVQSFHNSHGVCHLSTQSPRFQRILRESLREFRMPYWFYPKIGVLVISGFDRTDTLLISDRTDIEALQKMLKTNNLHILSQTDDNTRQAMIDDLFDF